MPKIIIHRLSSRRDVFRRYKIRVDGVQVVLLKMTQTFELHVEPGRHVIEAAIDWCSGVPLVVDVGPDDVVGVLIRSMKPSLNVLDLTTRRNNYISIAPGDHTQVSRVDKLQPWAEWILSFM